MKRFFMLILLVLVLTSCGGSSKESIVEVVKIEPEVLEKIEFDASISESINTNLALTSDSPDFPIEVQTFNFTALITNIESGLIIRFTIVNDDASSYQEILTDGSIDYDFSRSQSRTRPLEIRIKVYSETNKDNFTEKIFVFNGSWVEK